MWIYLALAAGFSLWYYETHKPAAAKPGMGAGPVLDANMSPAAQDALIKMVMAQTDPAVLDGAAVTLANAPPPGPYPLAAAWVKSQAAVLRAKQIQQGGTATLGEPPIPPAAGKVPDYNGIPQPTTNLLHPTMAILDFKAKQAAAPSIKITLKGKALASFAWQVLQNPGLSASDAMLWHNLYILGELEDPSLVVGSADYQKWIGLAAQHPDFFGPGGYGANALGWPDAAPAEILATLFHGAALSSAAWSRLNSGGSGQLFLFGPDNNPSSTNQIALPPATLLLKNLYILGQLEQGLQNPWLFMAGKKTVNVQSGFSKLPNPFFAKGTQASQLLGWG